MIEGGCCVEEVALLFGWTIADTIHTIAPALKANPEAAKRVRRIIPQLSRAIDATPAIHRVWIKHKGGGTAYNARGNTTRKAA
jgi:hypothetical protein